MSLTATSDDQVRHRLNNPTTADAARAELIKRGLVDCPVMKEMSKRVHYGTRRYVRES